MQSESSTLEARVRRRLDEVLDPCSTFTDRPQSIVDLGLVDCVSIDDGIVTIDLLPTNQLCMYVPHMTEEIEARVGEIPSVDSVTVETVADKLWTQDRMTAEAADERAAYFRERVETHDISPAYDGERWTEDVRVGTGETTDE